MTRRRGSLPGLGLLLGLGLLAVRATATGPSTLHDRQVRAWRRGGRPIPAAVPQDLGPEFHDRLRRHADVGLPIHLAPSDLTRDGLVMVHLVGPEQTLLRLSAQLATPILARWSRPPRRPLDWPGADLAPALTHTPFTIPEAVRVPGEPPLWVIPDEETNPPFDRGRVHVFVPGVSRAGFPAVLATALARMADLGAPATPRRLVVPGLWPDAAGRPHRFLDALESSCDFPHTALLPCTYIMPGRAGSTQDRDGLLHALQAILTADRLTSVRHRSIASPTVRVKRWQRELGQDHRVFLTHGPGITYGESYAALAILSPRVLWLEDVQFVDRDAFFMAPTLLGRDALSMTWYNSYRVQENPTLHAMEAAIARFNTDRGLDTVPGRIGYLRGLEAFFQREGLTTCHPEVSSLNEAFNNEVRVRGHVPVTPFVLALVVPDAAVKDALLTWLTTRGVATIGGVPVEDWLITPLPHPQPSLRWTYLEFLLRMAGHPAARALQEVRDHGQPEDAARILETVDASGGFWSSPHLTPDQARRTFEDLAPLTPARLTRVLARVLPTYRAVTGQAPAFTRVEGPGPGQTLTYLDVADDRLLADPGFIARIHRRCGRPGIQHVLVQELAARLPGTDALTTLRTTSRILQSLRIPPQFTSIAQAMGLSRTRIEALSHQVRQALGGPGTAAPKDPSSRKGSTRYTVGR